MTGGPPVLPLARDGEPVRYVLIDDEPRYRHAIELPGGLDLTLAAATGLSTHSSRSRASPATWSSSTCA